MVKQTTPPPDEAANSTEEVKKERRSRSRHAGSLADYQTRKGKRWKFQIYVLIDPEKPELGEKRLTRGGFTDLEEAQAELTEALKKKAKNEKFLGKVPPSPSTQITGQIRSGWPTPPSRGTGRSSGTTSPQTSARSSSTNSPPPGLGCTTGS